jgi:hypothetical protein
MKVESCGRQNFCFLDRNEHADGAGINGLIITLVRKLNKQTQELYKCKYLVLL